MDNGQSPLSGHLAKIILQEEEIILRVEALARQITDHYRARPPGELVVVGILRGAVVFMSDLIRRLPLALTIDFMAISSYGGSTVSSGAVRILKDISESIEGKHVLVVEDIVDTGLTLNSLLDVLQARKPLSLSVCALLNKPSRRKAEVAVDFCGFDVPDEFVVGYGLDYAGQYRHLPYIGVLKPEIYNNITPAKK
ncbi:MAG: hypoxanthine phosphoribosyltransferase [Clostridiales bacterium]|nr:hypoxanthine phosphoribosyltransferase [Clostridiales bacterium]